MAGDPFESGKTLVFMCMDDSSTNRYLDSSPSLDNRKDQVFLRQSTDYTNHSGTHWAVEKLGGGLYQFVSESTSSNRRYLDSSPNANQNVSVFLKDSGAGSGSKWEPNLQADGSYTLQCQNTSNNKRYLFGNPRYNDRGDAVYLTDNNNAVGSHWKVGVDYFTNHEVGRIVENAYPSLNIHIFKADPSYGTLDYYLLKTIWDSTKLGDYDYKNQKFDCDDFAVCMKDAVSKYSHDQTKPDNRGSLCGIMYGRNAQGLHAYNYTVDPFGELILFEPQDGTIMRHDEYAPYFCMM